MNPPTFRGNDNRSEARRPKFGGRWGVVALCAIGVLAVLVGALVRVDIKVTRELAHPEPPSEPIYHMIVDGAEPELVEAELDKRPSVLTDYRYDSATLLHLAVVYERLAILQMLLGKGIEPDMEWRTLPTPLMIAIEKRRPDFAEVLLDLNQANSEVCA